MAQYFRFLCRTVPGKYAIDPTKRVKDQPVFTEMSKEEMEQYNLVGMPLYLEHVTGIDVTADAKGKDTSERKKVQYHPDRYVLGHVVDNFVTDDGTMLTLCEIQPETDKQSERGLARHALRTSVIHQIQNDALDNVSFSHIIDSHYDKKTDQQVVQKLPMELSLTTKPLREGAAILHHSFYDTPYLAGDGYKNFDIYESAAGSSIDYAAVDRNDELDRQDKEQEEMAAAAPKQWTSEEISRIMAELENVKKENAKSSESLKRFQAREREEDEAKRKVFMDNMSKIRSATIGTIAELLKPENKIAFAPGDKETFEAVAKEAEAKNTAAAQAEPLILNEQRQKYFEGTEAVDPRALFKGFDDMVTSLASEIVACNVAAKYLNEAIETRSKASGAASRAEAKAGPAGVASKPQPKEREPEFKTWEAMRERTAAANKALYIPENEVPPF